MSGWQEATRIGDLPAQAARRYGDRRGLFFKGRRYSFREIDEQVDLAARALMAQGLRKGDHVALWLNNCDDWVFLMFAVVKAGAVLVPINTRFRTKDLEYVLGQSDSAMLITHDVSGPIDYLAMTREVVALPKQGSDVSDPNFPMLRKVTILGKSGQAGVVSWDAAKEAAGQVSPAALAERAESVRPEDPALIMYTSGTTGFPKGAMHRHHLIRNVEERAHRMAITPNDAIMSYLPLFHAFGFSEGSLMSVATGAYQIVTETFDPAETLDLVEAERGTILHGFEAHAKALSEEQERRPRDLSSLRTGIFGAGPRSATPIVYRALKVLAPVRSLSGFGMTETWLGVALSALDDDDESRCEASGAVGIGYELRIMDLETGRVVEEPDVEGELQVRGRYLMQGYYKKPAETEASFTADGWFKTGDTAIWRPNGGIRFLGRYKDMLKVGGENVDPMEVEGLLLGHPAVHQVAVVGRPDERLAEVAVAYVQQAEGQSATEEEIIGYCRNKVASFKIPRHVVFVDEFPMTASGKIRKVDLRADAKARFAEK
jgi:fatty-acyl-CoA synthase